MPRPFSCHSGRSAEIRKCRQQTILIMKYSKEFKALIDSTTESYIGHGNPNATILIIGQEGASDPEAGTEEDGRNDYGRSIEANREDWRRNIQEGTGYENLSHCCTPDTLKKYNPLYPYKGQKFQVRTGSEEAGNLKGAKGTARTWYNYQKLINRIFELHSAERKLLTKDDDIDFHRLSFHTDMSAVASKKHNHDKKEDAATSVLQRVSLLSSDFFRNFPIVIAAVGHFPRDTYGDEYFGNVFGVEFLGNEETEIYNWMNVSVRNDEAHPMLLIHTPQFSEAISDRYIEQIAKRVVDFAKEYKINLLPKE